MRVVLVRREKGEVGELVARRLKLDDMDCMDTMDDMDIQIKSHYPIILTALVKSA